VLGSMRRISRSTSKTDCSRDGERQFDEGHRNYYRIEAGRTSFIRTFSLPLMRRRAGIVANSRNGVRVDREPEEGRVSKPESRAINVNAFDGFSAFTDEAPPIFRWRFFVSLSERSSSYRSCFLEARGRDAREVSCLPTDRASASSTARCRSATPPAVVMLPERGL